MVEVARYTIASGLKVDTKDVDRALGRLLALQRAQAITQARITALRAETVAATATLAGASAMSRRIRTDVAAARQEAETIRRRLGSMAGGAAAAGGARRGGGGAAGAGLGLASGFGLRGLVGGYIGWQGVRAAGRGVGGAIGLASEYELAETSISSLLMTIDRVPAAVARARASGIFGDLRKDAAASIGELPDFLNTYRQLYAPARMAGASGGDLRKLTRQSLAAGYLFGGVNGPKTAGFDVLQALTQGIGERTTPIVFQALRAAGFDTDSGSFNALSIPERLKMIGEAFDRLGPAVNELAGTFEARASTLRDSLRDIAAMFGTSAAGPVVDGMEELIAAIDKNKIALDDLAASVGTLAGNVTKAGLAALTFSANAAGQYAKDRAGGGGFGGGGGWRAAMSMTPLGGLGAFATHMLTGENLGRGAAYIANASGTATQRNRANRLLATGSLEERKQAQAWLERDIQITNAARSGQIPWAHWASLPRTGGRNSASGGEQLPVALESILWETVGRTMSTAPDALGEPPTAPDSTHEPIRVEVQLRQDVRWGDDRSLVGGFEDTMGEVLTRFAERTRSTGLDFGTI